MKVFHVTKTLLISLALLLSGCGDERIIAVGGGALPDSFALADGLPLADGMGAADAEEMPREIVLLHNVDVPEQVIVTQELPIRAKVLDYDIDGPAANTLVQYTIVENVGDGDATLSSQQAYTDGDGEVVITFRSNLKSQVSYRVELFTEKAEPVYLVAVDHDGNTAVHNAAARGDNAMIEYLVSKGADVTRVNRGGQTTVDMANGPVQRVQPFPDTIALLEGLGATNNHKCVSC